METNSPAEELPGLYRAILDRVAELEAAGDRAEAARIRTAATRSYSRAWDVPARRELETLLRNAARPTAAERLLGRGMRRSPARDFAGRRQPAATPER
jgi:hypothetical protein